LFYRNPFFYELKKRFYFSFVNLLKQELLS